MILKILYSLNKDHSNLYLFKSTVAKLEDFEVELKRVSLDDQEVVLGLVNLQQCVKLILESSPELFDLDKIIKKKNSQNTKPLYFAQDYSVYNEDTLEPGRPMVGYGSIKRLSDQTIIGKVHESPEFLLGLRDNPASHDNTDNYCLEIRLQFIKYYRNLTVSDISQHKNKEEVPFKRKTNPKKAPKAVRTLSLPIQLNNKPPKRQNIKDKLFEADAYNDQPANPSCINCKITNSNHWSWYKEASQEGLVCKPCYAHYKLHGSLKPTTGPKSTFNIARSLAKNRSGLPKKQPCKQPEISSSPIYDKYQAYNHENVLLSSPKHNPVTTPTKPASYALPKSNSPNTKWLMKMLTTLGNSNPTSPIDGSSNDIDNYFSIYNEPSPHANSDDTTTSFPSSPLHNK